MYKALDISRYIINYSNVCEYGISNLKLQKLLYFVQAQYVAFTDQKRPCFEEEIEAWGFGPVVPEVYREFKIYGSSNISSVNSYVEVTDEWEFVEKSFDESCIQARDREIINGIVDGFSEYSAAALVSITHNQSPWRDAYKKGPNTVITIESIREYFLEK